MARMFNEKIRIYERVDFAARSVVALLVRCIVKAWYESIRWRVFNKNALHQMQLDAYGFRAEVGELLPPDALRVVDLMLREVEASAEDRCVEPQPLTPAVVTQILTSAAEM